MPSIAEVILDVMRRFGCKDRDSTLRRIQAKIDVQGRSGTGFFVLSNHHAALAPMSVGRLVEDDQDGTMDVDERQSDCPPNRCIRSVSRAK